MYALVFCLIAADLTHDTDQVSIAVRGDVLASAGDDGVITIWDLKSERKTDWIKTDGVSDICWAGKYLVAVSESETAVYDGTELKDVLNGGAMAGSDGKMLVIKEAGENVYVYSVGKFKLINKFRYPAVFKTPLNIIVSNGVAAIGCKEGGCNFRTLTTEAGFGAIIFRNANFTHYTCNGDYHIVGDATGVFKCKPGSRELDQLSKPGFPLLGEHGLIVFGKETDYLDKSLKVVKRTSGVGEVTDAAWWGSRPVVLVGDTIQVLK